MMLLLLGLVLTAAAIACALRAVSVGSPRGRVVRNIRSYGVAAPATPSAVGGPRPGLATRLVAVPGVLLARRIGSNRQRELQDLLRGAGFYRTPVAVVLGLRLLTTVLPPVLFLAAARSTGFMTLLAAVCVGALGW